MLAASQQFRTFFSHKYTATAINLYFWSILSAEAGFQFGVDEGTKRTSVTRLESMMRESDTIVGVYPFTGASNTPARAELLKESAYFRLETELAIRSGKPTLLFVDRRYASIFPPMPGLRIHYFDAREIESGTQSPSHEQYVRACAEFCREAAVHKARDLSRRQVDPSSVLIAIASNTPATRHDQRIVDGIERVLENRGILNPSVLKFPDPKNLYQLAGLDSAAWVVADVGPELFRTGLVGYMHGRFIPMLRMLHDGAGADTLGEHRCLYAGIEKGYDSDLLRWKELSDLEAELDDRVGLLQWPQLLIPDAQAAHRYFTRASLRKEAVFLSYCGRDLSVAEQISGALKSRFQDVFDYKDGRSIRSGRPWLEEIDINLRKASVGVQLLTPAYLESPNCMEEARIMNGLLNDNKIKLLPLKLNDDDVLQAPTWLSDKQYAKLSQIGGIGAIADVVAGTLG